MSALAAASPRPPTLALLVTLLAVAVTGCAVAVVALIAAAPGPALLTTTVLALAGWLVRAATAVPAGWLLATAGLAVLITVWPGLLLLVLAAVVLARGGPQ